MTTTIFSTVDGLTSRFKLVDRLIDTVATRLLPQHEAKGATCPSDYPYYCGSVCTEMWCYPRGDLYYERRMFCANEGSCNGPNWYTECCNCCPS
jgi:hypothetical protein